MNEWMNELFEQWAHPNYNIFRWSEFRKYKDLGRHLNRAMKDVIKPFGAPPLMKWKARCSPSLLFPRAILRVMLSKAQNEPLSIFYAF